MNARWGVATSIALVAYAAAISAGQSGGTWRDRFDVDKADLLPTGTNAYITMQPGRIQKLAHGKDTLTVTILRDTQVIDGITAGVLEERETKNGKLVEVSRNFMATHRTTGDVYYLGEDVDNYKNGKIVESRERVARRSKGRTVRPDDSRDTDRRAEVLPGDRAKGRDGPGRGCFNQ